MRRLTVLLLGLLAAPVVLAQVAPAFEVASVKALRNPPADHSTGIPPPLTNPGQVNYSNVSLTGVLTRAYNVKPRQIIGPEWLSSDRFSIIAKAPADAAKGQIPAMLQTLLTQRFGLKIHWETSQEKGYSLVVGKMGAKLTKSAVSDEDAPLHRSSGFTSKGHLTWKASTLEDFAASLTIFMGSPVVDRTEMPGVFDIAFDADPDSMPGMPPHGPSAGDFPNHSITDAIRSLGLDLRPGEVSVKHLVVDAVNRVPTED